MKSILFVIVGLFANIILGQNPANEELEKAAILKAEDKWTEAIIKRDSITLEQIMSQEYTLNGKLPRAFWLKNTLNHLKFDELRMLNVPKVTVYGDIATCEAIWKNKGTYENEKFDENFFITDIWKKRDGKWEVYMRLSKESK